MRERIRDYELMLVISTLNVGEQEITTHLERVQRSVVDVGGTVSEVDSGPPWGRRKLAYPIREFVEGEPYRRVFNEGFYALLHFSAPAHQITTIERGLKLNDAVLRYLLTQVDPRARSFASGRASTDESVEGDSFADESDE